MASSKNRIEKLLIQARGVVTTCELLLEELIEKETSTQSNGKT